MELHTAHHASMQEAVFPAATEAAASDPAPQQLNRKALRLTYQAFREFSNTNIDHGGVFWEHFNVADLLQILMVSTRVLVGGKPVKVEMVSGERPLTMCSDSGTVLQIASNLLGNAARYTDRGRITLILCRQQNLLTLMDGQRDARSRGQARHRTHVRLRRTKDIRQRGFRYGTDTDTLTGGTPGREHLP